MMLVAILRRELFDHLQSLRFAIGFALIVGLFTVAAVSWNVRYERNVAIQQKAAQRAERTLVAMARGGGMNLAMGGAELWRPVSPTGFLAGGQDRGLPNYAQANESGIRLEPRGDRNPLLSRRDIDWTFIIGFVGSLLALLLTHDSIAGEKEVGSLRQVLANPVPRDVLLLGKFLGALLAVAIPVLVGAVLALLIMVQSGQIDLSQEVCGPILGSLLGGFLCLSASLWLGLFISCRTDNASLALMIGLVLWTLFSVFIPTSGSLVGSRLVSVPSHNDLQRDLKQIYRERRSDGDILVARAREDYWRRLLRQLEVAQLATRISPVAAYRYFSETLSSSGIAAYRGFLLQAESYRHVLLNFAAELDRATDVRARAEEAPVFRFQSLSTTQRVVAATDAVIILLFYNMVFFIGAYLSFRRYDVR